MKQCIWALPVLVACLSSCSTVTEQLENKEKKGDPVSKVFYAQPEEVEEAMKIAMSKYPQAVDNPEAGIFETDYVKIADAFVPPHKRREDMPGGYRYKIRVNFIKGKASARTAVKVIVTKTPENLRNFFSEPEKLVSDTYEEDAILYRISRELQIKMALKKASKGS